MKITYSFVILFLLAFQLEAEVRLPQFFSDNMVLQRNQDIKVWGWADKNEKIILSFNGQVVKVKTNKNGEWYVTLKAMKASSEPLTMVIEGKNTIRLNNILIGDVWICSGQSNMEWPISSSDNFKQEVANANFPNIRIFDVPRQIEFKPAKDIEPATWTTAEGANITDFSAVGYFFGRHIHQSQKVPIGLISSNWGGTTAEAWTSAQQLKPFEYTTEPLQKMADMEFSFKDKKAKEEKTVNDWVEKYFDTDDLGNQQKWYAEGYDTSDWKTIHLPSPLESKSELKNFDGTIWFKKKFILKPSLKNTDLYLRLGTIKHLDVVYLNGVEVARSINAKAWRSYKIPKSAFYEDKENELTIKIFNPKGEGGLVEVTKPKFSISPARWQITEHDISLVGDWNYKISDQLSESVKEDIPILTKYRPNDYPSSLFNGMIHPLIPLGIKGVIWYQGESNAKPFDRAIRYEDVFKNMISDWRERWGYDFEFYFVQLANYWNKEERCDQPCEQSWAYLRESQIKTLELPNTGMAVIIDVGDAKDIHPTNKQSVGYRLGLIADAKAYKDSKVVYSGPTYKTHQVKGNLILISFDHVGSGLLSKNRYGYLNGFQIAGKDQVFYWARAWIENGKVIVVSDQVPNPLAVRYAWENNPEDANLYNQEGLPATPFRTDDWELYKK